MEKASAWDAITNTSNIYLNAAIENSQETTKEQAQVFTTPRTRLITFKGNKSYKR